MATGMHTFPGMYIFAHGLFCHWIPDEMESDQAVRRDGVVTLDICRVAVLYREGGATTSACLCDFHHVRVHETAILLVVVVVAAAARVFWGRLLLVQNRAIEHRFTCREEPRESEVDG